MGSAVGLVDYALGQGCGWIVLDEFAAPNLDLPQYSHPT
jgi:hypothetical protein